MMPRVHREGVCRPVCPSAPAEFGAELAAQRLRLEAAIEAGIDLLDRIDAATEDLEDSGEWEPWLAAPEGHMAQLP